MECRYCRAQNAEDDHRCHRCGRRLRMTPVYTGQSAAAPDLRYEILPQSEELPALASAGSTPQPPARRRTATYQPSLFSFQEVPRPVQFESLLPAQTRETPVSRGPVRPRARKAIPGQQDFQFATVAAGSEALTVSSPASVSYDTPVAVAVHRLIAGTLDGAIILLAVTLFLTVFYFVGGHLVLNKQTLPLFGGIAVVFALLYKTLWALANGDTPGMQWARLRLVNFDGDVPDREQRLYRLACGCISLLAAGLGLLWALVDEEALTWHDHMSKTFPTPY